MNPQDAISRALRELSRFGHDNSHDSQFLHAHQQGKCYLCHVPYANAIPGCPCPHWFVMPWPSEKRFAAILEMYGLSGVLHYLLPYVKEGQSPRQPYQTVTASLTEAAIGLHIRLKTRQWSFSLTRTTSGAAPDLLVRMKTRSKKDLSTKVVPTERDVEILRQIVDSVGPCGVAAA